MGVSTSVPQLLGKMSRFTALAETTTGNAIRVAALQAKVVIEAERAAAGAGSGVLRGVKRGGKLGLRIVVDTGSHSHALIQATGPWPLIERDTKPHTIPRLVGSRSRAKRRLYGPAFGGVKSGALNIPGIGVRALVHHPGTKGKHPFAKGAAIAITRTPAVYEKALEGALISVFGGV